jgi:hypothetical protein
VAGWRKKRVQTDPERILKESWDNSLQYETVDF